MGPQSPLNRNLERLLEEAQVSGELRIASRRLREFPKVANKYNLNDTVYGGKGVCCQFAPFVLSLLHLSSHCHVVYIAFMVSVARFVEEQAVRVAFRSHQVFFVGEAQPLPQCDSIHTRKCVLPAVPHIPRYQVS